MSEKTIKTVLVCYTQGAFDKLALNPDYDENQFADEPADSDELLAGSRQIAALAEKLTLALQNLEVEAEIVRVPLRSYAPRDLSKAAFGWRLLDLSESNGRPIDMLICLDFPAWSVSHPRKLCWVLTLPFFVTRQQVSSPLLRPKVAPGQHPGNGANQSPDETALNINSLLQTERRGLSEARRVLAAQRSVAEELARSGLQLEYNPTPPAEAEPTSEAWQKVARRFLV